MSIIMTRLGPQYPAEPTQRILIISSHHNQNEHLHVGYDVQDDERAAGVPGVCVYHAGVERGSTREEGEYTTLYPMRSMSRA